MTLIDLECIRCGAAIRRERRIENHRIQRGCPGPYCSRSCTFRHDDPRQHAEPNQVPGAKWLRLTQGRFALVDEDIFDKLNLRSWHWLKGGTSTGHARSDSRDGIILLHHAVLGVTCVVDHKNNDGLDCRRENLRTAGRSENGANRGKFVGRPDREFTSRYKGVVDRSAHLASSDRPWLARIRVDGQLLHLGRYPSEKEAALAYDKAALQHFGEFAKTNFPPMEVRSV